MSLQLSPAEAAKELLRRRSIRRDLTDMKIIVDDADRDLLDLRAWKGINRSKGYFKARIKGEQVYLHRLIAGAKQGELVDHIDGNPLNNRRSNLRVCSYYESNANRAARRDSRAPNRRPPETGLGHR